MAIVQRPRAQARGDVAPPVLPARVASGRLSATDRLAEGVRISVELSPIVVPSRDVVVRAVRDVLGAGAHARAGRVVTRGRWRFDPTALDEQAERAVRELPKEYTGDEGLPRLREIAREDLGFTVFLGEDRASLCIDHRLGDGFFGTMLTSAVLAGRGTPAVFTNAGDEHPLESALWNTFARHPRRVASLVGDRWHERRPSPAAGTVPGERASLDLVSGTMTSETFRAFAAWSHRKVPPSVAMLFALRAALDRVGIPVSDEGSILVDLRRYLPSGRSTLANFVTGHPVRGGGGVVPAAARFSRDLRLGRPLAALAVGVATAPWRRHRSVSVPSAATPIVSDMGFLRTLEPLPWAMPTGGMLRVSVDPARRNGVTALTAFLRGRLHVSMSFDATLFDRAGLEAACALMCADPIGLLE
ncbi:hypothetical protein GCM10022200_12460 [Microbacterium awajiense]|uniref:Condensation domain-containing protein n=1 Tax=Microbacterium awajiense TaxID=415214 RepID=A0ABP7AFE0_9MICO